METNSLVLILIHGDKLMETSRAAHRTAKAAHRAAHMYEQP